MSNKNCKFALLFNKNIKMKDKIVLNEQLGLFVQIVGEVDKKQTAHGYVFKCHDISEIVGDVNSALIGTNDQEPFAINFGWNDVSKRIGFAAYVDGVPVLRDKEPFKKLTQIEDPSIIHTDQYFPCQISKIDEPTYIGCFFTKDGGNPQLVFTHDKKESVNLNLTGELHKLGKIECFFWLETPKIEVEDARSVATSFVGEGKDTNTKLQYFSVITNPKFLGKVTFYHSSYDSIQHEYNGRVIYSNNKTV